jgi:uncharacterized membrane protein
MLLILTVIPIACLGILYPIFSMIYFISYAYACNATPYVRTKKGNEVNEMLEGLKNYIKDFSLLNQESKDGLILWEDYLIYSVLFDQNKKVVQEFEKIMTN